MKRLRRWFREETEKPGLDFIRGREQFRYPSQPREHPSGFLSSEGALNDWRMIWQEVPKADPAITSRWAGLMSRQAKSLGSWEPKRGLGKPRTPSF